MAVEVYICKNYQHSHERKAFGKFLQEMLDRYKKSDDLYVLIVEPEVNTAAIDLIILTHRAIIAAELKDLIKAKDVERTNISLHGKENGPWEYVLENSLRYYMGSASKGSNPYQQIKNHRYKLRDWLENHSRNLLGGPWKAMDIIQKIDSWVIVSPGFNPDTSSLDLPWKEIEKWFKLRSIDDMAWEVGTTINPEVNLSVEQMIDFAQQLGATKRENLSEFVPNYVPPSPKLSFFSRPPIPKFLVDRDIEKDELQKHIYNQKVSIISLGGPGGIGKTYLAAYLFNEAISNNTKGLWIECSEREVTVESFLAAIADKMTDDYQAALIHDPDKKIADKFDLVLSFIDTEKYIIVFNDYHLVSDENGLDEFFTQVIHKSENIKILLTTRKHLTCFDNPEWPPASSVEYKLDGLPLKFIPEYTQMGNLTKNQLTSIWKLTSGNPFYLGLLTSLMRRGRWVDEIENLPLFDNIQTSKWAESLINALDKDAKALAGKIAVIRSPVSVELITKLAYKPYEQVIPIIDQLVGSYILYEVGFKLFHMHYYIRNAILANTPQEDLTKAHKIVGSFYEKLSKQVDDTSEQIETLLQCIYHYENGENWNGVSDQVELAYNLLMNRGDKDRSWSVSKSAIKAAKKENNKLKVVAWLVRIIRREIDLKMYEGAQKHLNEAFTAIPKPKKNDLEDLVKQWKALEAALWIEKASLAYHTQEPEDISSFICEGLNLAYQVDDKELIASSLLKAGRIERLQGKIDDAKKHLTEARKFAEQLETPHLEAMIVSLLGLIVRDSGDLNEAQRLFQIAIEKEKLTNNTSGADINKALLGDIALRTGDFITANNIFKEGLERARSINNSLAIRINLGWLADSLIGLNRLDEAEQHLNECNQISSNAEDYIGIAWVLKRKGQLEQAKGNITKGNDLIYQGIRKLEEMNDIRYLDDFRKAIKETDL